MTYLGRKSTFMCDTCKKVEHVAGGLPKGWCFIKTGGVIEHACVECRKLIPADKQCEPGQK